MKCSICKKEIGKITGPVTISGGYSTENGHCEISLDENRIAHTVKGSEKCSDHYQPEKKGWM